MLDVSDLSEELAATRHRIQSMIAEMRQASIDWRDRVSARVELLEKESTTDQREDDVPPDAPRQYAAVRERVSRGEFDWFDVLSGRVDDPEARAVHMWADSRMAAVQRAWRLLECGAPLDDAVNGAVAERRPGGERR